MHNDHRPLSRLLQLWQPRRPEPLPDFTQDVWVRIHAQRSSVPARIFPFPRSLRAAAFWAAALSAFGGSAAAYAYDSLTRDERMAAAHARAIDPLQIVAAPNTVARN